MAAITKRLLHLRPIFQSHSRPSLQHFSSSSDPDAKSDISQPNLNSESQTRPSLFSSLDSVKATLHQPSPPQNRDHRAPSPSRANSNEDIRRRISEFRSRSAPPPPSGKHVSLQEMYERNQKSKADGSANSSGVNSGGNPSLDPIIPGSWLKPGAQTRFSMAQFGANLKQKHNANVNWDSKTSSRASKIPTSSILRGDGDSRPSGSIPRSAGDNQDMGKKLKTLRPQNRKGKWFSLQELSDRLAKLKEAQKKENGAIYDIKADLFGPKKTERKVSLYNILPGGTESYDMSPPKTELVEQYFHPDNLSSAEKLKLELQKVREEFKMSESDCGSTRVQVAQLTLKIKHLSTVLQKKDKHSRKGLQAMVERRKKLLKYLRRTDWDSYCLVLSKLGLRDNPVVRA